MQPLQMCRNSSCSKVHMNQLILYTKPGCHLCEGLQEKLEQVEALTFELEIRNITTRDDWFQAYQYEVPVLYRLLRKSEQTVEEQRLPRLSPRATVQQLQQMLQQYLVESRSE